MIKVLLCTPYKQESGNIVGGMAIWGENVLKYYASLKDTDLEVIPISFDRTTFAPKLNVVRRVLTGIKELFRPILRACLMMKRKRIDCIHVCTSASMSFLKDLLLLKIAQKNKIKSVLHFHHGRTPEILRKKDWESFLLKKVLNLASVVVTMNATSHNALRLAGYTKVVNLPNPLSVDVVQSVESMEGVYTRVPNRILYVGHVIRTKGVWELIEACSKIQGIEVRLVGGFTEDDRTELRRLAGADVDQWCSFVGELNHKQVLQEFLQAGLFVFPSYAEGFPNVILEAMVCGCPIASSDVGAIPEILDVSCDPCGLCYKPRCSSEVESAICSLVFDENRKSHFATKAKNRVYEMYTMPKVWKQLVKIWKS